MFEKRGTLVPARGARDPFAALRQMTSELDRMFDDWPMPWRSFRQLGTQESVAWAPKIDVFERDNRLVTRVDLPGMKKEDVSVEVTDGSLVLRGERKRESEEKKDHLYRSECEYGQFLRTVPLPEGTSHDDVKATFANGVLEVSVPMPQKPETQTRKVPVEDGTPVKSAAA